MSDEQQQHLEELISIKTRRLRELEKKVAFRGIDAPVDLIMEIEDIRKEIADITSNIVFISSPYQNIVQRYPSLKKHVYNFEIAIERSAQGFIGREWLFEEVEHFIHNKPCGYLRIVGEPGIGRTAIAAKSVMRYNALAHFFNKSMGIDSSDACLNHLSVQLIARYNLPYNDLPEGSGENAAFLTNLLIFSSDKKLSPTL